MTNNIVDELRGQQEVLFEGQYYVMLAPEDADRAADAIEQQQQRIALMGQTILDYQESDARQQAEIESTNTEKKLLLDSAKKALSRTKWLEKLLQSERKRAEAEAKAHHISLHELEEAGQEVVNKLRAALREIESIRGEYKLGTDARAFKVAAYQRIMQIAEDTLKEVDA